MIFFILLTDCGRNKPEKNCVKYSVSMLGKTLVGSVPLRTGLLTRWPRNSAVFKMLHE